MVDVGLLLSFSVDIAWRRFADNCLAVVVELALLLISLITVGEFSLLAFRDELALFEACLPDDCARNISSCAVDLELDMKR